MKLPDRVALLNEGAHETGLEGRVAVRSLIALLFSFRKLVFFSVLSIGITL